MKDIPLDRRSLDLLAGLSALANPARLQILEVLADEPESIVADLVRRLPLAQATVSQHLKVLQEAGLIHDERERPGRCCRIDFVRLFSVAESLSAWAHALATRPRRAEEGPCRP